MRDGLREEGRGPVVKGPKAVITVLGGIDLVLSSSPFLPAVQWMMFIVIAFTLTVHLFKDSLALHLPEKHVDVLELIFVFCSISGVFLRIFLVSGIFIQKLTIVIIFQMIVRNFLLFVEEDIP